MSKKEQTLDTVGKRCQRCLLMAYVTYTCSTCNKTICLSCQPEHQNECNLVNTRHHTSQPKRDGKEMKTTQSIYQYQCSICKKRELQKIICPDCHQQFCIEHRKQFSHHCKMSKQKSTQSIQPTQQKINGNGQWIHQLPQNEKLIRLKKQNELLKKAIGNTSIPLNQRMYFEILVPDESIRHIYLNKTERVSQAMKSLCSFCHLDVSLNGNELMRKYSLMTEEGTVIDWNMLIGSLKNYSTIIILIN